ncbi:hypothetical protein K456DRAFT_38991 [Colletotrichum gloeosporioides 23]|nr:hypothetical protein K456DRAFT_38991 [Colletotrichum gloeosporioides 23]
MASKGQLGRSPSSWDGAPGLAFCCDSAGLAPIRESRDARGSDACLLGCKMQRSSARAVGTRPILEAGPEKTTALGVTKANDGGKGRWRDKHCTAGNVVSCDQGFHWKIGSAVVMVAAEDVVRKRSVMYCGGPCIRQGSHGQSKKCGMREVVARGCWAGDVGFAAARCRLVECEAMMSERGRGPQRWVAVEEALDASMDAADLVTGQHNGAADANLGGCASWGGQDQARSSQGGHAKHSSAVAQSLDKQLQSMTGVSRAQKDRQAIRGYSWRQQGMARGCGISRIVAQHGRSYLKTGAGREYEVAKAWPKA